MHKYRCKSLTNFKLLITPKDSSDNRSWTALKADAGQAGFIGSDDIDINAQSIGVNLNLVQNDNENVIDFANAPLEIQVGPVANTTIDFHGENGNMMSIETYSTINLFDFFQTEGNVAFEQMRQDVDIMQTDGSIETHKMNIMTAGVEDFSASVQQGSASFSLTGVDIALAMISDPSVEGSFLTLTANAAEFTMTADGVDVVGSDAIVLINQGMSTDQIIHYADNPLEINIGPESSILTDIDGHKGDMFKVQAGMTINIYDFFYVDGNFSVESYTNDLLLSDGSTVSADYTVVSGSDGVEVFVGINGPANTPNAMGFELQEVNFALALMDSTVDDRSWSAVKAFATEVGLVNIPHLDIAVEHLNVEINIDDAGSDVVADFSQNPLTVDAGLDYDITLDFDGAMGPFVIAEGDIRLNVADFLTASGKIAIATRKENLTLNTGEEIETDVLTLAGTDVGGFAGYGHPENSDNSMGFILNNIDFGMAYARPTDNADERSWVAFEGTAGYIGFQGPGNLEVSGSDITVQLNVAATDDTLLHLIDNPLTINSGEDQSYALSYDTENGPIQSIDGHITLNLFDFITIDGNLALSTLNKDISVQNIQGQGATENMELFKIGASQVDIFAGLTDAENNQMGLSLSEAGFGLLLMRSPTTNIQFTSLKATAGSVGFVGIDGLTVSGQNMLVELNQASDGDAVAHFADNPFTIAAGNDNQVDLNFDAAQGDILKVSGFLDFNMFDFFHIKGNLAFEKTVHEINAGTVNPDDGIENQLMNVMTVGASGLDAFVGIGNQDDDTAKGFALENVNFGMALMSSMNDNARYMSLKATTSSAGLMGIDNIDLSVTDFTVSMNRGIDTEWSAHFADQPFSIATGGESISLNFDARNGTQTKAHGTMNLNFGEFFSVEGNLSVESFTDTINVSDGTADILSNILTIGASDINAFVGSSDQTTGINLSNLDFALAIIKPTDTEDDRTFTSLTARADSAGFRGIDDLTLEGNDIFVAMNLSSDDNAFADFSQKPLNIDIGGGNEVTFNLDGSLGQIKRLEGAFDISIHDFFQVNGQLGFEHYSRNFTLADESTVETTLFTVGASGLEVFAGIGPKDSDNALGFAVDQASFGLALITPKDSTDNRSWTALRADADQAGFIGSNDITINAQDIGVNLNLVHNDNENVIDFASDPLEITVGPDTYTELDFNGEKGNMLSIETYSTINLFDFFQTEGNIAFEKIRQDVDIMQTDGSIETHKMNIMTVGLEGFSASAQQGTASFALTGVDIALAMISDPSVEGSFLTLTANAAEFTMTADGVDVVGSDAIVLINQGMSTDKIIHYADNPLEINIGPESSILTDIDGHKGDMFKVQAGMTINIYDFFYVDGNFSVESYTNDLLLSDGSTVSADYTVVSGSDGVEVFVGINGPANTPNAMGFELQEVNFALALMDSTIDDRSWSAVKAFATEVGLVNIPGLDIAVENLNVEINIDDAGSDVVADFSQNPLSVDAGLDYDITLDFDGAMGPIVIAEGDIRFKVADFLTASGKIAIATRKENLTLNTGEEIETDVLTLAGTDVGGFAGYGHPENSDNSMGFILNDIDFGMAYARPSDNADERSWVAFEGTAGYIGFQGPGNLEASGSDITVQLNVAATDDTLLHLIDNPLTIDTGEDQSYALSYDTENGPIQSIDGHITLNLFDFITIDGNLALSTLNKDISVQNIQGQGATENMELFKIGASQVDIFAGLTDAENNQMGLSLSEAGFGLLLMRSPTTNIQFTSLKATAGSVGFVGIDGLTVSGENMLVELNQASDSDAVAHFADNPFTIAAGNDNQVDLNFDAAQGDILKVSGFLDFNMFDFFHIKGNLAFEKTIQEINTGTVNPDDGIQNQLMNVMTVGASGLDAFVGIGNQDNDTAKGFALENVNFGMALMSSMNDNARYMSLKASAGSAGLIGIDHLDIAVTDFGVSINRGFDTEWFAHFMDQPFNIATGGESITLDFDARKGMQTNAFGSMKLNVGGFFNVEGSLSVASFSDTINLSDGSENILANILSIGASDINAFVGTSDQATGFKLSNLDFAVAIINPTASEDNQTFTSLSARAESAAFIGIDDLTIEGNDLLVEMNLSSDENIFADFSQKPLEIDLAGNNAVTEINTGVGSSISLDVDGQQGKYLQASGTFDLEIFNFFHAHGNLSYEQSTEMVDLSDNTSILANIMKIGATDVSAFAGINGPIDSPTALGFGFNNASFGMAIVNSADNTTNDLRSWVSLKAAVKNPEFVGTGIEGLDISTDAIEVAINKSAEDNSVVNWSENAFDVNTGGQSVTLDFDGSKGEFFSIEGHINLNVFDFFHVNANLAFEKFDRTINVIDDTGTTHTYDTSMLTMGASQVDAFMGINGPADQPDAIGLVLNHVNFGLAIMNAKDWGTTYTSMKAEIGSAGIVGIDGFTLESQALKFALNTVEGDDNVAHLAENPLIINTGDSNDITLDFDAQKGKLMRGEGLLTLGIADYKVDGSFSIERSDDNKLLFGAAGSDIFLGTGKAPYDDGDDQGVLLEDTRFGLILSSEDEPDISDETSTMSLYAAGSASLIGIPDLSIDGTLEFKMNDAGRVNQTITLPDPENPDNPLSIPIVFNDNVPIALGGTLALNIANGNVSLSGGFAFEKDIDHLIIGGSAIDVFMGKGPATIDGDINPDASGVLLHDGQLGLIIYNSGGYGINASGSATILGINDFDLTGSIAFQQNTTGVDINETITVPLPNGTTTDITIAFDASMSDPVLVGALDMAVADAVSLSGTFVVTSKDDGEKIIIGAQNIEAFMGANAGESDAIGVKTTVNNLGLVLVDTSSGMKYALAGSGGIELVGLDGLEVSGDVGFNINTTGMAIDETIDMANPLFDSSIPESNTNVKRIQTSVTYADATPKLQLSGDIELNVVDIFKLSGTVEFEKLSTGVMTVVIPQAVMAIVKDDEDLASVSGKAAFTIAPEQGFQLDSWGITGFSLFGIEASLDTLTRSIKTDTFAKEAPESVKATNTFNIGPLSVDAPTVSFSDLNYWDSKLVVTLGLGVESAGLNFGESVMNTELTGLLGSFDVAIDVLGVLEGNGSVDFTGKWNIDIDSIALTVPDLFVATAEGVHFGYDPYYDPDNDPNPDAQRTGQTILTIDSAFLSFPSFGISGHIQTFDPDGTGINVIPGLTVWEKGFKFGTAMIAYGVDLKDSNDMPVTTGESDGTQIKIGNILVFDDIRFGVSNFGIIFGESLDFDGEIFIASGGAKFFPDSAINASITDSLSGYTSDGTPESQDDLALYCGVTFTDGKVDGFKFEVDTINIDFGKFLSLYAEDVMIDTSAGPDEEVVSFSSIGASLAAGPLQISGEARNFAFSGSGEFITHKGFGVFFAVDNLSGSSVGWPDWLPVIITELGIEWRDINADPTNFILTLSAAVSHIPGIEIAEFSGAIEGVKIDMEKLYNFEFPIIDIGAISVAFTANAFGGEISAGLLGGILKIDENDQIIPSTAPMDTPVAERILFMGAQGGLSISGLGGFGIRFALSELGPPEKIDNAYQYKLPEIFDYQIGEISIEFQAGTFQDLDGNTNEKQVQTYTVQGPKASLINPYFGTAIDAMTLDNRGTIDVRFEASSEGSLDLDSILDEASEFTLTDQNGIVYDITGVPDVLEGTTFTYELPDDVTFTPGEITITFKADSFSETSGLTNLAQSQTFTVSGATAMITDVDHKGYINKGILNSQGYIDVEFQPTDENTMDADSILDTDAEFKLTGEAAESVTIKNDSVEKIDDNTFRYSFDGAFTTGAFTLALIEDSFSDTGGFSNLGKTKTIQALVSQGTIVDPTPLTSQDRAGMNSKGYLLVDYTDPFGVGLDESSITDSDLEFRLGGKGAGSVVVYGDAEKFEQDGKTYWKYAYSGDFQDGLVTVNYIKDSWIDSAGNYGDAQMQEFAIFSQAQAFEIRLFGGVELDGGGFLPDLDKDGSPDKLVSLTGDVTITQDSVRNTDGEVLESSLTLDISATLELFYLGNIASAGGRFILASGSANPEPTDSIFGSDSLRLWGALKIESNLDALQNLGIEAEQRDFIAGRNGNVTQ